MESNPLAPASFHKDPFHALLFETVALGQQLRNRGRGEEGSSSASGVAMCLMELIEESGPQTVPQLARAGKTSRQNIQVQVNRLIKAGFLELRENPAHRKSSLVALTADGSAKLESSAEERTESLRSLFADIPETELAAAWQVLRKIRQTLSGGIGNQVRSSTEGRTTRSEPVSREVFVVPERIPTTEVEEIPISLL